MNVTISATNNQGLLDPTPLIYTVAPPAITLWPDSSASANNASPVGTPELINNAINGHKAVQFRSTTHDGFNLAAGVPAPRPFTIFVVMKQDAIDKVSWAMVGDGAELGLPFFLPSNADGHIYLGNRIEYTWWSNPANDTNWHVFVGLFWDDKYAETAVDCVVAAPITGATSATAPQLGVNFTSIGYRTNAAAGSWSDNRIAEIIFYNWIHGLPWQGVAASLGAKYNLPQAGSPAPVDPATVTGCLGWWKGDSVV